MPALPRLMDSDAASPADRLIVALDVPNRPAAMALVDLLGNAVVWYKVGLELYLAEGAPMVQALRERGKRVFLDLKLHDIPNTVASAVRVAAQTGAELLTVHAAGGPAMVRAAVDASNGLQVLGVTVLTSMDGTELAATGVPDSVEGQVRRLGQMALCAGAAGLICSPLEIGPLRAEHGPGPLLVVPGIRSASDASGDQQRTATAREAKTFGASMVVVGRPITRSVDPMAAAQEILRQLS